MVIFLVWLTMTCQVKTYIRYNDVPILILIHRIFTKDPEKRPSASEVLKMPFVARHLDVSVFLLMLEACIVITNNYTLPYMAVTLTC